MTVKEIIELVCDFVGEKEIRAELEKEEQSFSEYDEARVDLMVRCFNLVRQEIASDYLPFLKKEKVDVKNSVLNFSELSEKVINIFQVQGTFGQCLKFRAFPNHVQIEGSAKWVTYSFLPTDLTLKDEVPDACGLTARVYAYGVASEFLLLDGVSEDAHIWEDRFKDSLFMLSRKRGEHVLPKRRWL